ncbi:MAG: hypothetical protein AAGN15_22365 [Cyanobacteria bacterium J06581_3]
MTDAKLPNLVVAISGPSGAGKTSLVQKVTERLEDAVALHFDDYATVSTYPTNFAQWVSEGADPNQWKTPQLIQDLSALRRGESIVLPIRKRTLHPARFVIVEEPFGRKRAGMTHLIDFVVFVDLPLEMALARRLLRDAEWCLKEKSAEYLSIYLKEYLTNYLTNGMRDMYFEVTEMVLKDCDLKLNGRKALNKLSDKVIAALQERTKGL